jgi:hypothetical protein
MLDMRHSKSLMIKCCFIYYSTSLRCNIIHINVEHVSNCARTRSNDIICKRIKANLKPRCYPQSDHLILAVVVGGPLLGSTKGVGLCNDEIDHLEKRRNNST